MTAMVLEIAMFDINEGETEAFASAYRQAREAIRDAPGCRSLRMTQGIESPVRFILLIEWDSVEDHERFRDSEAFGQWREPIGPHFAGPPLVEHFVDVD